MQEFFTYTIDTYPLLAPITFILLRSLAIIIPPIPGAYLDVAGIAAFGWWYGFVLAEAGIMLGAVVAFSIARRFGEPVVARFAVLQNVVEWEKRLSEKKKFWALVLIRLPTNSIFDYISYAAGLMRIGFFKFFLSTLIGNVPGLFIFFYFGGLFYQNSAYYFIVGFVSLAIIGSLVSKKWNITEFFMKTLTKHEPPPETNEKPE